MTDLSRILPSLSLAAFAASSRSLATATSSTPGCSSSGAHEALIAALERGDISTADLVTLDAGEVQRRTRLAAADARRLGGAVAAGLHRGLRASVVDLEEEEDDEEKCSRDGETGSSTVKENSPSKDTTTQPLPCISTLDDTLDAALGGGFPAGYVSEVTGESGAAKTQLLLTLLLAVQLPPPRGLGRSALYISTEAPLATPRLAQLLAEHPVLAEHRKRCRLARVLGEDNPTMMDVALDNIVSASTPDLESQEHILTYQVPVEVARRNVGLVVLDSVAANYRAEYGGARGSTMAKRGNDLVRLGAQLRDLATAHGLAVVVANQVADRFPTVGGGGGGGGRGEGSRGLAFVLRPPPSTPAFDARVATQESPLAARSKARPRPPPPSVMALIPPSSASTPGTPRQVYHHHTNTPTADNLYGTAPPADDADDGPPPLPALLLDHQQRWFTGWGDEPVGVRFSSEEDDGDGESGEHDLIEERLKTPSLGLVWSTQIACRVALLKRAAEGRRVRPAGESSSERGDGDSIGDGSTTSWQRWFKVVYAPHVPAGEGPGVEFEVTREGVKGVVEKMYHR
jgi:DNA repair protein RAD57